MKVQEEGGCPTFRPTRAAFERPFCDFVKEVFRKHPDLPCFKVGGCWRAGGLPRAGCRGLLRRQLLLAPSQPLFRWRRMAPRLRLPNPHAPAARVRPPPPPPHHGQVVPPAGWKPRRRSPDLDKIRINTPIKQHVFGKSGSYVCILEEQRVGEGGVGALGEL